jgi:hypothetical protein
MWFRFTGLDVFGNVSATQGTGAFRRLTQPLSGRKRARAEHAKPVTDTLIDEDCYLSCVIHPQGSRQV